MTGMNGILCIDKPADFTSFDVVAKMRGIARTKKVGHGGTLDPMATGVLPLFFGLATKACDMLPDQNKGYTAVMQLGVTTDTQDMTGTVLTRCDDIPTHAQVTTALAGFLGKSMQLPPMYSAVRVNGQRLYDLARQGLEVERNAREIEIYAADILDYNEQDGVYTIDVRCTRGTFVRTLCHDLGQQLGCGAAMASLRRTYSCGFSLESSLSLADAQRLADEGKLEERLLPVERAFASLGELVLSDAQVKLFLCGVHIFLRNLPTIETAEKLRVHGPDGAFLGIAQPDFEAETLRLEKLFARLT